MVRAKIYRFHAERLVIPLLMSCWGACNSRQWYDEEEEINKCAGGETSGVESREQAGQEAK